MPLNKGYLTAKTNKASDEVFTPDYAVKPILKYINKSAIVWCPFDTKESEYVKLISKKGNKVIYSHIDDGKNFFEYEPNEHYDCIISNPPFSIKDEILQRLDELGKPYALLLPIPSYLLIYIITYFYIKVYYFTSNSSNIKSFGKKFLHK